jgi:hypothetical protein
MDSIKLMFFSIIIVSVSFVFAQGIASNYLVLSAEGSQPLINKEPNIITIQANSEDDEKESEDNENPNNLLGNQGGSESNETDGGLTGGPLSSESLSGTNQSEDSSIPGGETDNNQTAQSENQMNQDVDQTTNQNVSQTTNQNVNQTTNQNVNVEMKQRLELIISEEEGEAPISVEEQTRIESQDKIVITEHRGITGADCRSGNVLDGASNAEDLRVLAECQDAIGTVMHTKKMDDGDYKFFLNVDPQFEFLVNDKNDEETEGFLVVEIVPDHQTQGMLLPKDGDRVHVWGAWVTDKPKGWHEIHPAWKVISQ